MSRVSRFLRAEYPTLAQRNRPSIALIAVLVALVLGVQSVVGAGVSHYAESSQRDSALAVVELSGVSAQSRRDLTPQTLDPIATMEAVVGVYPWWQRDLALSDVDSWPDPDVNPGALWATPWIPGLEPSIVAGELAGGRPMAGQVVLPERVGGDSLVSLLGKTVSFDYTKVVDASHGEAARISLRVVAIASNTVPGRDGPTPAYLADSDLVLIAGGSIPPTFTAAFVKVDSAANVPSVQAALSEQGFAVSSLATQMSGLGGLFDVLRGASWIILFALGAVCLTVGSAAGSIWVRQRRRDIGTLKAIGWTRAMVGRAVASELAFLGLVAATAGLAMGLLVSLAATTAVANANLVLLPVSALQIPPWPSLVTVGLLVPACLVVGGLPFTVRAARLDPDDVIRAG